MNCSNGFSVRNLGLLAVIISLAFNSGVAAANGHSARLTIGDVSQGGGVVSTSSNPASGAFDRQYLDADTDVAGYWSFGVAAEYGNVDNLFDRINEASAALTGNGSQNGGSGGAGVHVDLIDDVGNPNLQALVSAMSDTAVVASAVLDFIRAEGYAVAEGGSELAILINNDVLGGTLRFDATAWVNTSAVGLTESINFNADVALAELNTAYNLQPGDPETTYDLTGGVRLTVDPASGLVRVTYENESLLLTRAAESGELGISYSRALVSSAAGVLYLGVRPKVTQVGLTRITTRLGDISDAEDLFDDVRDADFVTQNKVDVDLGVLWHAGHYRLGVTLLNLTEPEFDFPSIDYTDIVNVDILSALKRSDTFVAERQFKLEASWLSEQQHWGIYSAYDANAVVDAAGVESQWGSLSTAYTFENFWVNNVRVGVSRNFVGDELSYVSAGFTVLRFLKLDVASTLSETRIDGEKYPRGVSAAVGFNFSF